MTFFDTLAYVLLAIGSLYNIIWLPDFIVRGLLNHTPRKGGLMHRFYTAFYRRLYNESWEDMPMRGAD